MLLVLFLRHSVGLAVNGKRLLSPLGEHRRAVGGFRQTHQLLIYGSCLDTVIVPGGQEVLQRTEAGVLLGVCPTPGVNIEHTPFCRHRDLAQHRGLEGPGQPALGRRGIRGHKARSPAVVHGAGDSPQYGGYTLGEVAAYHVSEHGDNHLVLVLIAYSRQCVVQTGHHG